MFKTSFDLPAPKKDNSKQKNRKERKAEGNVGADDLQSLFKQLGRDDVDVAPATIEPETKGKDQIKESKPKETDPRGKRKGPDVVSEPKQKKSKQSKPLQDKTDKFEKSNEKSGETTQEKKTETPKESVPKTPKGASLPPKVATQKAKLTPMQQKMQQKLSGGRFRWINEQLYTVPSGQAVDLFKKSPELFGEYHSGFRHQVESWPENPVDSMIKMFKQRLEKPLSAPGGLPAEKSGQIVVADMGCGEAQLALQVSKLKGGPRSKRAKFTVHSFDLHKANNRITVADIANVPLPDSSAHVVVFCLALMGTNTEDFIKEALRILKPFGEIWISEIKSRFDIVKNKTDTQRFVDKLKSYGLHHKHTDESNKMFVTFQFVNFPKSDSQRNYDRKPKFIDQEEDKTPLLKPCIYKKR